MFRLGTLLRRRKKLVHNRSTNYPRMHSVKREGGEAHPHLDEPLYTFSAIGCALSTIAFAPVQPELFEGHK